MGSCNLVVEAILEMPVRIHRRSQLRATHFAGLERKPLHFNSSAVSISVIQGGVIRGLFIHPRCLARRR